MTNLDPIGKLSEVRGTTEHYSFQILSKSSLQTHLWDLLDYCCLMNEVYYVFPKGVCTVGY